MMTSHTTLPLFTLALLLCLPACSSTRRHGGGTATVEFVQPDRFTDIELRGTPPERTRELLLPDLERYLKKQAALSIPAGQNLELRITDIDDAGWIRPIGPTPRRIVRSSQPGRVDFEYTLTDSSGGVLESGRKTLSDLPWDRLDRSFDNEQLPLTKRLLSDWMTQMGRHYGKAQGAAGTSP